MSISSSNSEKPTVRQSSADRFEPGTPKEFAQLKKDAQTWIKRNNNAQLSDHNISQKEILSRLKSFNSNNLPQAHKEQLKSLTAEISRLSINFSG